MAVLSFLLAAIELTGVVGSDLRARAFFDANNVKVGDPMVLTVDFIGEADFSSLHPPELSRTVSRQDWKLYDESAKTSTFRDARRLTYRVRPMRDGVLWFPALEFEYATKDGRRRQMRSNEIPVHAKAGAQVVVEEMGEETDEMPKPPELIADVRSCSSGKDSAPPLSEDVEFAWRKTLAKPTADGFAAFDFPEAKMNEATCAIRAGNWARALKVYQKLEWRVGQTPEMERGIVAALALKFDNPAVELPVWRQVLRPLLRYGWRGRVGLVVGGFAALALLFWLLGRGIRAVACLAAIVGFAVSAGGQGFDPFSMMRQMERRSQQMMNQMMSVSSGGRSEMFVNGVRQEPLRITASAELPARAPVVGETFEIILSLEAPRSCSVGQISVQVPDVPGLEVVSSHLENLTDGKSANPTNVIRRMALPVRFLAPYEGRLSFQLSGEAERRSESGRRGFAFFSMMSFAEPFRSRTPPVRVAVRPPAAEGRPDDFAGIVSEGLRLHETCDILRVETNDVVTITYRMMPDGYVPAEFLPKGAAFEWVRNAGRDGRVGEIVYRRYFVADGAPKTPKVSVAYYDPRTKSYKRVEAGGTPLRYAPPAN